MDVYDVIYDSGGFFSPPNAFISRLCMCDDIRAIAFTAMSTYSTLLETAADEMTISLKTEWFNALLRQDLAYFDIKDVTGTASIISLNGAKYKK
jgi:hypothetical protein